MLPTAREHGAEANRRFAAPVPPLLIDHLVSHRSTLVPAWIPKDEQQTIAHGGLLIQLGPEEYLAAGSGVVLEMTPISPGPPIAGIESIWEGRFVGGRWVPGRLLNGDESHQGRHLRIPPDDFGIQRLKLYRYR